MTIRKSWGPGVVLLLLAAPTLAFAAEAPTLNMANTAWMLISSVLVLFMTIPGLALFYGGLVRTKNVLSILMQCFAITCMVSIVWVLFAYSLAFGDGGAGNAWLGGMAKALMVGIGVNTLKGDIPETVFALFQMTFAIIMPALVVGAFAERMKFSAMMLFSLFWLLWSTCRSVTGSGAMAGCRNWRDDFAGGTVVHINAGVAALVRRSCLASARVFRKRRCHRTTSP
jgi:Amt family ammonium transporter